MERLKALREEKGVIMLKEIPYSELKKDKRPYDIMILRDQYNNTFTDIAKDYEISFIRVRQIYSRIKIKQIPAVPSSNGAAVNFFDFFGWNFTSEIFWRVPAV